MPFDFTVCVESYLDQVVAEGQYTRELSWINLWNGVRPHIAHNTRHLLILDGEALERTALLNWLLSCQLGDVQRDAFKP